MKVLLQLLRRPPPELAVLDEETQRRFPDLIVKCLIKQTKNLHKAIHVSCLPMAVYFWGRVCGWAFCDGACRRYCASLSFWPQYTWLQAYELIMSCASSAACQRRHPTVSSSAPCDTMRI